MVMGDEVESELVGYETGDSVAEDEDRSSHDDVLRSSVPVTFEGAMCSVNVLETLLTAPCSGPMGGRCSSTSFLAGTSQEPLFKVSEM